MPSTSGDRLLLNNKNAGNQYHHCLYKYSSYGYERQVSATVTNNPSLWSKYHNEATKQQDRRGQLLLQTNCRSRQHASIVRLLLTWSSVSWSVPSPIVIQLIKSRKMRLVGHVTGIGQSVTAYRVLLAISEGKWPFGRSRHTREDNIKVTTQQNVRACAVLLWLRRGIGGKLLWPGEWNFGFQRCGEFLDPEKLLFSHEGFCSMDLFVYLMNQSVDQRKGVLWNRSKV